MAKGEMPLVSDSLHALDTITNIKEIVWPVNYNSLIDKTTDETLESTRRMVQLVEEANEYGVQSLTHLDEHDEKLRRIECDLTDIDEEMEKVNNDIFLMEHLCKLCRWPCEFWHKRCSCIATCSSYYTAENESAWQKPKKSDTPTEVVTKQPTIRMRKDAYQSADNNFVQKIFDDAKEDEMNANMRSVDALLTNLKGIALDINTELNLQKAVIDNVDKLVTSSDVAMGSNSKRLNKLTEGSGSPLKISSKFL